MTGKRAGALLLGDAHPMAGFLMGESSEDLEVNCCHRDNHHFDAVELQRSENRVAGELLCDRCEGHRFAAQPIAYVFPKTTALRVGHGPVRSRLGAGVAGSPAAIVARQPCTVGVPGDVVPVSPCGHAHRIPE